LISASRRTRRTTFRNLFSYLPPAYPQAEGAHVLAYRDQRLGGHAVVTIRWLQVGNGPLPRMANVDAAATSLTHHRQGIGSAVMRHLATVVDHWYIAGLETERVAFYERLDWEEWQGPLGAPFGGGVTFRRRTNGVS